jgi:hypothetical protein
MCLIASLICTAAATTAPAEPAADSASTAMENPASNASEEPDSADFDFPESWGPINDSWFPTAEPTSAGAADEGGQ